MRKSTSIIIFMLTLSLSTVGQTDKNKSELYEKKSDKERIYNISKDVLWASIVKAVKETYIIKFLDEKNAIISFGADSTFKRGALDVSVALTEIEPNKTQIKFNMIKKSSQVFGGGGKDVAEKLFKEIDKLLTENKHKN